MNSIELPGTDLRVSEICLGTMTWGEQTSESDAHEQLDFAAANGVNFIDSAEMYPIPPRPQTQGRSEAFLGSWLARQGREKFVVATKVTGPGRRDWVRGGRTDLTRANILEAADLSLRRMQTDYIDLYQIHWPQRNVAMFGSMRFDPSKEKPTLMDEQVDAMAELAYAGKIRYWGVSNETAWGVCEFQRLARERGAPPPVTIQNTCNLLHRTFEWGLAEACYREGLALLAYSPLAQGMLTGKYAGGARPAGARFTLYPEFGERWQRPGCVAAAAEYLEIARRHGIDPAAMALAFVRGRRFVASTIIGATRLGHIGCALDSLNVALDDATLGEIDQVNVKYPSPAAGL